MAFWQVLVWNFFDVISFIILLTKFDSRIKMQRKQLLILYGIMIAIGTMFGFFEFPLRVVILTIIASFLLKHLFSIGYIEAAIDYILTVISVIIIQVLLMFVLQLIKANKYSFQNGIIINCTVIIICLLVYKFVPLEKIKNGLIKYKKIMTILLTLIVIPLFVYAIGWDMDQIKVWSYAPLLISGVIIWVLMVVIIFFEVIKLREQKKALSIYEEYNPMLEHVVEEIRSKQHDINNHLHAIYGIAEKNEQYEITEYIDKLVDHYHQTNKFIQTGNNIISAVIYSKKCEADSKGIEFEFNYDKPLPKFPVMEYEMVEILGNLIDNAIDATHDHHEKKVIVNINQNVKYKSMEVVNAGHPIKQQYINKMFNKGFSTKGKNRGYGLYNVNRIIKSYNGIIELLHKNGFTFIKILFK